MHTEDIQSFYCGNTWSQMKFTNSNAAEPFWVFGLNEVTNKKIRKHQLIH